MHSYFTAMVLFIFKGFFYAKDWSRFGALQITVNEIELTLAPLESSRPQLSNTTGHFG